MRLQGDLLLALGRAAAAVERLQDIDDALKVQHTSYTVPHGSRPGSSSFRIGSRLYSIQ